MRVLTVLLLFVSTVLMAQNRTDCSLFLKSDSTNYLNTISSPSGDLFNELGHHGPAIENEFVALRMYFDHKAAIDVYSKQKNGLELKKAKWYPSPLQQKNGWGADYYKAGATVGLGGIRLWDGEKVVPLNPVSQRSARVVSETNLSYMEMLSEGVPYKDKSVDILVRVTVYSGIREAKVEAFALCNEKVQFITGVNYHKNNKTMKGDGYLLNWGQHPEDVASEKIEIGAALMFDKARFVNQFDDGTQLSLVSHPTKQLEYWISSTSQKDSEINELNKFLRYVSEKSIRK